MALDAATCACYLFATWTYLHGYAFQSLGTLEALSGRGRRIRSQGASMLEALSGMEMDGTDGAASRICNNVKAYWLIRLIRINAKISYGCATVWIVGYRTEWC
jgi:hypothetical protein